MRKAPPKTHTYTIVILLVILGVTGGALATEYPLDRESVSSVTSDDSNTPNGNDELPMDDSGASQNTSGRDALNPQESASRLQPASGSGIYANYDSQAATSPRQD